LNISGNNLGDKIFSEICLGVSKNGHLIKFFSSDNELGKISAIIIGTILKYDKKLKALDISKNLFNDEIISYVFKGLISNSCLECLMLNETNITNKSIRILETTLHINTTLQELYLEKNKLNNKCCSVISDILNKNKSIEYLSLVGNKIDNDGVDVILDRQRRIPIKIINKSNFYQMKLNTEGINFYEYI
jgi:Ran GTPase-activating protein (RanGAP) involved in mRNA processing and transport